MKTQNSKQVYKIISNGTIISPEREIKDGVVIVKGEKIIDVGRKGNVNEPTDAYLEL